MKKKILITILLLIIICLIIPCVALADDVYLTDGQRYDLGSAAVGDVVHVPSGITATLTGTAKDEVRVICEGATVNLESVNITRPTTTDFCPITMLGDNIINLIGLSKLDSGMSGAGIVVDSPAKLTIRGDGTIDVYGAVAGIGSLPDQTSGDITIESGTINAYGTMGGAGIGGGIRGSGGSVTITGGMINASSDAGAGIGGGDAGMISQITISGGTIKATSMQGAGIGGGYHGGGCNIDITGGVVYAGSVIVWGQDIGYGTDYAGTMTSANISDSACVFLKRGQAKSSINTTHSYTSFSSVEDVPFWYDVPSDWTYPVGAYINMALAAPRFTEDEANSSQTIYSGEGIGALAAVDLNDNITSYTLVGGSLPDGVTLNNDGTFSGTVYVLGNYSMTIEVRDADGNTDTTTLDLTVIAVDVNVSPSTVTLGYGEQCTLSATTEPSGKSVSWFSYEPTIASVDISGVVTASTKEGIVTVIGNHYEGHDKCLVYVVDKSEPAPKPSDPKNTVVVQIKDNLGDPLAGEYVSLFSNPKTVVTDSNGVAVFRDVIFNTNDPHTLIMHHANGMDKARYSLIFASGTTPSVTIDSTNINVSFHNSVNCLKVNVIMVEDSVNAIAASLEYIEKIPERVENPQTGDSEQYYYLLEAIMILIAVLLYMYIKRLKIDIVF